MPGFFVLKTPIVYFFTDFGADGLYLSQMETAVLAQCPEARVIDLLNDAPSARPAPAAYLLAALADHLAPSAIVVGVVDPGVGGDRRALVIEADGRVYVGPDNGLFSQVIRRARSGQVGSLRWDDEQLSASFHGRDLFAPVAGMLADGLAVGRQPCNPADLVGADWGDMLAEIIYIDHYGNAMTGISAAGLDRGQAIEVGQCRLTSARTFYSVPEGHTFWYENSIGLVEIATNKGRAAAELGLAIGDEVTLVDS